MMPNDTFFYSESGQDILLISLAICFTLRRMSKDNLGRAEREGNDFPVMYVHAKDLELASPRDTV